MVRRKSTRIAVCLMSILLVIISTVGMGTVAVSAAETDTQTSGTGGATAVLNNAAGWSNCYVYYWGNSGSVNNATWPGVKLTDADKNSDGYYEVTIPESCLAETNGVIFNAGSGGAQSADLDIASGECKIYNNSTGTWEEYDTNPIKLKLTADCESPQYKGTDIVLTAEASGTSGSYTYTFKANSTTIYTGSNSTCTWTPTTAGTFTVSVEVKDTQGNTNSKSLSFEIKDDSTATNPVLKGISTGYTNNKVPVNSSVAVNVNATGGKIGTNLLFYKVEVLNPSGNAVNTVYYKQTNILNFTPTQKGNYTVNVTVQNSYNDDVKKTYTVTADETGDIAPSISSFTANPTTVELGKTVTLTTKLASGTGTANFMYAYAANGSSIKTQTSSSSTDTLTWTPTKAGSYTISVTVTDSKSLSTTKTLTIKVIEPEYTAGDANLDNVLNVQDVIFVMKCISGAEGYTLTPGTAAYNAANMNGDSTVNVQDVIAIMRACI